MQNSTIRILLYIFFPLVFNIVAGKIYSQCPIVVNLGNDTILCPGTSITLDAGPGEVYIWDDPGITTRYRTISSPGRYSVAVKIYNCELFGEDEINIEPAPKLDVRLLLPEGSLPYFCKGETVNISSHVSDTLAVARYNWSVSPLNVPTVEVDTGGQVNMTVIDKNGCAWVSSMEVEFQYPYEKDSIILVTYDHSEEKNIIIYSRSRNKRTREFVLYNGYTKNDSFTAMPFSATNLVVDRSSQPHTKPSFYNITLIDSCLNHSSFNVEKTHKTIFLSVKREANGSTTLSWDKYIGFAYQYFYISRGTNPDKMSIIDSIRFVAPVNQFTYIDNTSPSANYYYQILVKTPDTVYIDSTDKKARAGPFVHSASNLEDNRLYGTGIKDIEYLKTNLKIFPNPYRGSTTISYEIDNRADVSLKIYNITGQQVAVLTEGIKEQGRYEIPFSAKSFGLPPGLYYLKYSVKGAGVITRKLVEQ